MTGQRVTLFVADRRPQDANNVARTSGFIPLPPKRRAAGAAPPERA